MTRSQLADSANAPCTRTIVERMSGGPFGWVGTWPGCRSCDRVAPVGVHRSCTSEDRTEARVVTRRLSQDADGDRRLAASDARCSVAAFASRPGLGHEIARCLRRRPATCRATLGARVWSLRARCCGGVAPRAPKVAAAARPARTPGRAGRRARQRKRGRDGTIGALQASTSPAKGTPTCSRWRSTSRASAPGMRRMGRHVHHRPRRRMSAIRLCGEPRCPEPAVVRGRCSQHATEARKANRSPFDAFYGSKAWKIARRHQLFEHPLTPVPARGRHRMRDRRRQRPPHR
jgi:hypothetical protein